MKFNTNNKAAQKQRRIGALKRLRVNLEDKNKRLINPSKVIDIDAFKAGIVSDIRRINAEITVLEERTKL